MELKDYMRIIAKSWSTIFGVAVVIALITIAWTLLQTPKWDASNTIVVNKANPVPQRGASYYQYDKYYSIQASSLYADTLGAWLSSPDTATEIYLTAGLPVPSVSLKKLAKIFKPRQQPPVTLNITVTDRDKTKAQTLVNAAVKVISSKVEKQRKADDPDQYFTLISGRTVVAENKQDIVVNTLLGLIGGLMVGFITAFLREYLHD